MKKYDNFVSHLTVLGRAGQEDLQNEFIVSGITAKFSLQVELTWKLLKETLAYEGVAAAASGSPREILKAAFAIYDFLDEDLWLEMLRAQNDLAHIYDGDAARILADRIINVYVPVFEALQEDLDERYGETLFQSAR